MYLYLYLKNWLESLKREEGQDLIEYVLIAGLIAIVAVVSIGIAGQSIQKIWQNVATQLQTISSS